MSESRILWRRASRGIYFLGLGAFLLLTTQGVLPWSFWREALSYWPVLLVGLGIRMIFEKTRAPGLILLSPLVVLGTLAYLALNPSNQEGFDWTSVKTERPEVAEQWTLEGELALVHLDLEARPLEKDRLVQGRVAPGDRHRLRLVEGGEHARVRLGLRKYNWSLFTLSLPTRDHRWDLGVTQDLPLRVDMDLAFAGGELDLDAAPVKRVEIEGAFNDLTLRLGAPETDTRLIFQGAFNQIKVIVPDATPVRVNTDGFLNLVDGRSRSAKREGPSYRIRFDGAFNRLAVRSP